MTGVFNSKCPISPKFTSSASSIINGITILFSFKACRKSSLSKSEEELFPDNMQRKTLELISVY